LSVQLVPPEVITEQIFQGRIGHYFRSSIPGFGLVTWQLVSFQPPAPGAGPGAGVVSMNVINPNGTFQFMQVSTQDLVGLQYLGPTLPVSPGPGPGPGPGPRPPWCQWFPWHPQCSGGMGGPGPWGGPGFGREYVAYVPVIIPYPYR
jgi:hypothetical protein